MAAPENETSSPLGLRGGKYSPDQFFNSGKPDAAPAVRLLQLSIAPVHTMTIPAYRMNDPVQKQSAENVAAYGACDAPRIGCYDDGAKNSILCDTLIAAQAYPQYVGFIRVGQIFQASYDFFGAFRIRQSCARAHAKSFPVAI